MRDVAGYLSSQVESTSEVGGELNEMWRSVQTFHQKRLWHQLTEVLLKLVLRPELQKGDELYNLYTNVIADFETKLNPLSLVQIITPVLGRFSDKDEAVQFIEKIGDKVKANTEAYVLTRVLLAEIQLNHYKNKDKVKELIEEVENLLNDIEGVGMVHGRYYLMASELYKQDGNHAEYYRASLRYLGCTDLASLSPDDKVSQAFYLCLAALLGKDIFNFGELLAHQILESLRGTPNQWIVDVLVAFNAGDVAKYEAMRGQWSTQSDLKVNEMVLYEKVCLLALMEMTFRRSSTDRLLTFEAVAAQTHLPVDKVELLVMKALAKGLVKGSIDQVDQTVNLTWVQPRVLDKDQVKTLMSKISNLNDSIRLMENMIENNASEILTV